MATEISPTLAGVISQLDLNKVPDKLHCPACGKFLINGYKPPCCDQTFCEPCYEQDPSQCPVCEHKPFSKDLCSASKPSRTTAKAFLKTQEKKLAKEKADSEAAELDGGTPAVAETRVRGGDGAAPPAGEDVKASGSSTTISPADVPQPSIEDAGDSSIVDDDKSHLLLSQQPPSADESSIQDTNAETSAQSGEAKTVEIRQQEADGKKASAEPDTTVNGTAKDEVIDMSMNMNNFANMDFGQMMQFANANGMSAFNPMMAGFPNMSLMMNAMSQGMFGGFGESGMGMNGMNGMNMGMNFNPNSGMFGSGWNGQNNNMWNGAQNNNANAFPNGFGGDFGSNSGYGYNNSNFQYSRGDIGFSGRGYGRGRGRGRGAYSRGRGNFHNAQHANQPNFQNAHEQQQYEIQSIQAQMMNGQAKDASSKEDTAADGTPKDDDEDDDFAPGGQDEVEEALGEAYHQTQPDDKAEPVSDAQVVAGKDEESMRDKTSNPIEEVNSLALNGEPGRVADGLSGSPELHIVSVAVPEESPLVPVSQNEPKPSMPPPTAPLGPSSRHREPEDYGFRARGSGKYPARNRGSFSGQNEPPVSPNRSVPSAAVVVSPDPKGVGVIGAPTGPKAMREPPSMREPPFVREPAPRASRPSSTSISNSGGFQIMGRASRASQSSQSRPQDRSRSITPVTGSSRHRSKSRSPTRQQSRHSRQDYDQDTQQEYDRDHYDRDRKRRKSKRHEHDDHDMQDTDTYRSRSLTPDDRKSSHRSRHEKDRISKHRSSRSHRHHDEVNGEGDHQMDECAEPTQESESRSSHHRSNKSSRKHDDRERDRDRDREDRHRERDKDRKRSRHDRDHDGAADEIDVESRHRSRRHKKDKDHHRDHDRERERDVDTPVNGSHRSSETATPVSTAAPTPAPAADPHMMEREARNRERMLKEQQRRAKADENKRSVGGSAGVAKGMMTGGRRVSYKYEDDLRSVGIVEGEREREGSRWR